MNEDVPKVREIRVSASITTGIQLCVLKTHLFVITTETVVVEDAELREASDSQEV